MAGEPSGPSAVVSTPETYESPCSFEALGEQVMDRLVASLEEGSAPLSATEKSDWFNEFKSRIVADTANRVRKEIYDERQKPLSGNVRKLNDDTLDLSKATDGTRYFAYTFRGSVDLQSLQLRRSSVTFFPSVVVNRPFSQGSTLILPLR